MLHYFDEKLCFQYTRQWTAVVVVYVGVHSFSPSCVYYDLFAQFQVREPENKNCENIVELEKIYVY